MTGWRARIERMSGLDRRDRLPALLGFLSLLAWSTYAYLTIRIDSDMVAEMMQVQQWMQHPFWVLSYPGQLHGGVLEYPLEILAEAIAPGNPYGFTLVRVLYLPLIGLFAFINFRMLFPAWSLWWMATAMAIAPAVLHSMMIIKDLYAFSWLLASIGVTVLLGQLRRARVRWPAFVGGLIVGLALYEQPTSALFSLPILLAAVVSWQVRLRQLWRPAVGFFIGLVPLVLAITTQGGKRLVYTPAGIRVPDAAGAFGLTASPDGWNQALVPNGWGIEYTDLNDFPFSVQTQFILNSWLAGWLLVAVVIGSVAMVKFALRRPASPRSVVAVMWGASALLVVGLVTVVPPIYFYGTALAPLVWMTVGALPHLARRWLAVTVTVALLATMSVTTLGTFMHTEPKFKTAVWFKREKVAELRGVADALTAAGVHVVYGDYWEVLPIAYVSSGRIHALTTIANRFPLPKDLATGGEVDVAVPSGKIALPIGLGRWPMAQEATDTVEANCLRRTDLTEALPAGISVYRCPVSVVDTVPQG